MSGVGTEESGEGDDEKKRQARRGRIGEDTGVGSEAGSKGVPRTVLRLV